MTSDATDPIRELSESECWTLLGESELGRLAIASESGIEIFPVNYLVNGHDIYFSSAPGSKLVGIAAHPQVAFEVDGVHARQRWSVVVKGTASRVNWDDEIESSGVLTMRSLAPTDKWNYVRISPTGVTGRRFSAVRRLAR